MKSTTPAIYSEITARLKAARKKEHAVALTNGVLTWGNLPRWPDFRLRQCPPPGFIEKIAAICYKSAPQ